MVENLKRKLKVGFIGAGKVGFTLGKYLSLQEIKVTGYYSRNTYSSKEAAEFTGTKAFCDMKDVLSESDVIFLTVPDSAISEVYDEIKSLGISGKFVCHTSGALSSKEAFPDIRKFGAYAYSVHPMFAVSNKYETYKELKDVFFTLETEEENPDEVFEMLKDSGLNINKLEASGNVKAKYHLASAVAANLYIALMDCSIKLLSDCGFSEEKSREALKKLTEGNLEHIISCGAENALTGPVERGDLSTIKKHLACFENADDKLMYIILSQRLVEISQRKNPKRDYKELKDFLSEQRGELQYEK